MLPRQCGNQLPVERARETSKLIAIIDDDESMQDSLRDLMEAAGLVARCFGSAGEFLESGLHRQAACLITDILMPKMSGLQFQTRHLRHKDVSYQARGLTVQTGFEEFSR